jgi:hypothetical protein
MIEVEKSLKSSSLYREDRLLLEDKKMNEAQILKEKLEEQQRNDRKLREKFKKSHSK